MTVRTQDVQVVQWTGRLAILGLLGGLGCAHAAAAPGPSIPCPTVTAVVVDGSGAVGALGRRASLGSYEWIMSRDAAAVSIYPGTAEVDAMVGELATVPLVESARPLRYEQAQNDCQHRAHVAASYVLERRKGWLVGKALIQGQLGMAHGKTRWGWHIAPVVMASHGGEYVALVLDPAVDDTRGLRIVEWIAAIDRADSASPATLEIAPADRWQPREEPRAYCDELVAAGDALRGFAANYDSDRARARERTRVGVKVRRIEPTTQRVWFEGSAWFHYPESLRGVLEGAKNRGQAITIRYRKVHIRKRRIHYLHIHEVGVVESDAPVAPPAPESLVAEWDALAGVVAGDALDRGGSEEASLSGRATKRSCETGIFPFTPPRGCESCPLSVEEP